MNYEKILLVNAALLMGFSLEVPAAQLSDTNNRQIKLEEVIVTATKREVNVQDVPQAITVFGEQMLEDSGILGITDLVGQMAGVELRQNIAGEGDLTMRGIPSFNSVPGGPGSPVGLYLDEMPLTMAGVFLDIKSFDVNRIEVLRGPQGTLFGEGSMAGTIRLISNKPDPTAFNGKAELTYSDTNEGEGNTIGRAVLNVPLGDTLALRVSGLYSDMGGYIDYVDYVSGVPTTQNANTNETRSGRFVLGWTPSDRLEVNFSAVINSAEIIGYNVSNRDYEWATSIPRTFDDKLDAYNLTIEYDLGFATLVSSTSAFDRDIDGFDSGDTQIDDVNGLYGLFGLPEEGPVTAIYTNLTTRSEAFSQELRLVSNDEGKFNWTAGLFYKSQDYSRDSEGFAIPDVSAEDVALVAGILIPDFPVPITSNLIIENSGTYEQVAIFGEVSYDITDNLELLVGGRYFEEDRDSTSSYEGIFPILLGAPPGELLDPTSSGGTSKIFNPKLSLTYSIGDSAILYGTLSKGFRSGGQNDYYALLPGAPVDFEPEQMINYEVGLKSAWMDNRLIFNISGYYMDWEDVQVTTIDGPASAYDASDNVGDAHSMGVDLEITAEPVDGLVLAMSVSLLETETDTDFALDGALFGDVVPSGAQLPGVPEESYNLSAQYNFALFSGLDGMARLSYAYVGEVNDAFANPRSTEDYSLVNARFGVEAERWSIALFVDNLTDEFVVMGKAREDVFPTPYTGQAWITGRPRTIGLTGRVNF